MAGVLTEASKVLCGPAPAHGGTVAVSSTAKLTVGGHAVLLESSIADKPVSGCGITPASDPSGPTAEKCLKVSAVPQVPGPPPPVEPPAITGGRATKLTVGSSPVMLDTLAGFTNGMIAKVSPQQNLTATAVQTKLTAI